MPPRSFRLALGQLFLLHPLTRLLIAAEPASFKKSPSHMRYAIAGIGLTSFDIARIRRRLRWNWISFLDGVALMPGIEIYSYQSSLSNVVLSVTEALPNI